MRSQMKTMARWGLLAVAVLAAVAVAVPVLGMFPDLGAKEVGAAMMLANAPLALPEVKELLSGIMKGFEDFKKANDERLDRVEKGQATGDVTAKLEAIKGDLAGLMELKGHVEKLEMKQNAAGLLGGGAGRSADAVAHKGAFLNGFVRKGETAGLLDLQVKAMSIGSGQDGGFAVPEELDRTIEKLERDFSPMRQLANVVRVGTSDYKKLVNRNGISSGWVGETAARPATNTSQMAELTPFMGELYAKPQITQHMLDDAFFDVEGELTAQLVEEFAVAEGAAFFTGDGTNKPKGLLAYATAATADSTRAFGTVEHVATGVAGDWAASNKADHLYAVVGKLKRAYRTGAVWTMNKGLLFDVMQFKDGQGQYLWQPRLTDSGLQLTLIGYPVVEAEDMPTKAANSLSIAFGNFKRAYTIVDRMGMRMLRDPYSNKPYVEFYTTKRVGGMLVNSEAVKLSKFAAA
jgi:HK97 family phage major capsid protein